MKARFRALATIIIMSGVSHALGAATPTGTILSSKDVLWTVETPGPQQVAKLWGDRATGRAGVLVKVPGGWRSEVQSYTSDQHVVLISGRWVHEIEANGAGRDEVLSPGSYWNEPAGERHRDRCEQGTECVVLVFAPEKVAPMPFGAVIITGTSIKRASGLIRPASELKWVPQSPDVPLMLASLWGHRDQGHYGELVRMPAGFNSGLHAHTGNFYGVLVSGTWIHMEENGAGADQELGPGSYVMQPGRGMHVDQCKQGTDCILFLYQDEKGDVTWPDKR
jgi:quercetin dioxygenase-like cupin family protein